MANGLAQGLNAPMIPGGVFGQAALALSALPEAALAVGRTLGGLGVVIEGATQRMADGVESVRAEYSPSSAGFEVAGPAVQEPAQSNVVAFEVAEADRAEFFGLNPNATGINSVDGVAAFMNTNVAVDGRY